MFCEKCGNQLSDDAMFCPKCGNSIVAATDQPVQESVQQSVYEQPIQQPVYQQPVQQPVYEQPVQQPVYQQPLQQPIYGQPPMPEGAPKKSKKGLIIGIVSGVVVLAAVVVLLLGFLVFDWFGGEKKSSDKEDKEEKTTVEATIEDEEEETEDKVVADDDYAYNDESYSDDYVYDDTDSDDSSYSDTTPGEYEKGTITGTTYESEFLGIKFECPSGYTMDDSSWDAEIAAEMIGLDDTYQDAMSLVVMELMVTDGIGEANVNIVVSPNPTGYDISKYSEMLEQQMNAMTSDDISIEVGEVTSDILGGYEYGVLPATTIMYDMEFSQEMYFRQVGDYYVLITFTGNGEVLKSGFVE